MNDTGPGRKSISDLNLQGEGPYTPSQFMRARRPELFSDSELNVEGTLNKESLDYHLGILTSKKQEIDFEHLCRRLAEQEICPNLIVQTGPTGGGDSKVDTENYPVAQRIASRWYQGLPNGSGERWAFAFSAKREWRSKVRGDVESIAATKRGYKVIYFITNQYVKDKSRAQVEDQLTGKHKVRVRILDRSWLLKCIFEHGRQPVAIETLHLDVPSVSSIQIGPKDLQKIRQLDAIEARILDSSRYVGVEYQLVEDCLNAAILSRNLERPRIETEGRFSRAQRIAESVGIPQQVLRVAYHRAWTAYWWNEDWSEFLRYYDIVEPLALSSSLTDDVELALNLWQLLHSACLAERIDRTNSGLEERRCRLGEVLSRLGCEKDRPNNALSARTHLAFLELVIARKDGTGVGAVIKKLIDIVSESEGLIDYPIEPFARIVDELGTVFADVAEYDELVETIVDLTQKRAGQERAGRLLLARGFQKLRNSQIYGAIRLFGRAQQKLALRESRDELSRALFAGGLAYEGAGLLWAARANTLASANLVYAEAREGGPLPHNGLQCARKLIWLELQLGRVPHALQWIEFAGAVAMNQGLDLDERKAFVAEREAQDLVLALLFLKADLTQLMDLRFLPDILDRLDLQYARIALLYSLGYEDLLRSEGSIPADESDSALLSTFTAFMKNPGVDDLPSSPTALSSGTLTYTSPVLGCDVIAKADADYESQRLAERILAGLEALLATSIDEEVFPYREVLTIEIHRDSSHLDVPRVKNRGAVGGNVLIVHGGRIADQRNSSRDWLLDMLTTSLSRLVMIPEPEAYMRRIFGEESGLARSINFTESAISMANILGPNPKTRISDWNLVENPNPYVLKRKVAWHGGVFNPKADVVRAEPKFGTGEVPREFLDADRTKHTERRVSALIDIPLWDRAKWKGAVYIWPVDLESEPWLALGFLDGIAAKSIFANWHAKVGPEDRDNRIQISVLTGVDRRHPAHYSMIVGSNLVESENRPKVKQYISVSRIHRMEPHTSKNLTAFTTQFERFRTYQLMPAQIDIENGRTEPYPDLAIRKYNIRIRPAWQVEEHDPDGAGIFPEDDPILPEGVTDPPVLKLLKRRRARR